ncbi:hypothetical protein [Gloeobacter kilaueensis]|uniref:AAA ATPase containing von Willebrand factor type A (VWA) domain n=1 Tax=Gloeobacter kilaueensis (strain ATCC BAA-2537 / CCAP 1431/1 / ULC 316 / JS1) TaxID=1183438 RepID=U5QJQ9_GLOK1|nr:hypothetical protein [Gloeobacter kilaueensis]AGY59166.1 AAA ATPase containing von Willebrand factor type A (vWA) domain [Gloeobacter kilaueensis JS1]
MPSPEPYGGSTPGDVRPGPQVPNPVTDAQDQDDANKLQGGVQFKDGTKVGVESNDPTQGASGTVTIPIDKPPPAYRSPTDAERAQTEKDYAAALEAQRQQQEDAKENAKATQELKDIVNTPQPDLRGDYPMPDQTYAALDSTAAFGQTVSFNPSDEGAYGDAAIYGQGQDPDSYDGQQQDFGSYDAQNYPQGQDFGSYDAQEGLQDLESYDSQDPGGYDPQTYAQAQGNFDLQDDSQGQGFGDSDLQDYDQSQANYDSQQSPSEDYEPQDDNQDQGSYDSQDYDQGQNFDSYDSQDYAQDQGSDQSQDDYSQQSDTPDSTDDAGEYDYQPDGEEQSGYASDLD